EIYDNANEEETFEVPTIGSNAKESYNQLQISDMIEARLEEIYAYAEREIRKMGIVDLPGGYVLTGGTMKMPGVLELAQDLFRSNVRIAIADYIGVREPQYTAGIGILQFAYHNARIQGKNLDVAVEDENAYEQPTRSQPKPKKADSKEGRKKESKLANMFKYF